MCTYADRDFWGVNKQKYKFKGIYMQKTVIKQAQKLGNQNWMRARAPHPSEALEGSS